MLPEAAGLALPTVEAVSEDGASLILSSAEQIGDATENAPVPPRVDLFRWDVLTGDVRLLTPDTTTQDVDFRWASADLDRVLFYTTEDLVGPDAFNEGTYERVGNGYVMRVGGDSAVTQYGDVLEFWSGASYAAGDTTDDADWYAWSPSTGVYQWLTADSAAGSGFMGMAGNGSSWLITSPDRLAADDLDDEEDVYQEDGVHPPRLISTIGSNWSVPAVDDNADRIVVWTTSPLLATDVDGTGDLYLVQPGSGHDPVLLTNPASTAVSIGASVVGIDADGSTVVFRSDEPLVPGDQDTKTDVYRWHDGVLTLVTPSTKSDAGTVDASTDLTRFVFTTSSEVLPEDTDIGFDSYVADFDIAGPTPVIAGPSGPTPLTTADLAFSTTGKPAARTACRVDDGDWAPCPETLHLTRLAEGWHTAQMNAWTARGYAPGQPTVLSWMVDPAIPSASIPRLSVPTGSHMGTSAVTAAIAWNASVANGVVSSTSLERSTDGGAWTRLNKGAAATSATSSLVSGHGYRFRATTTDDHGGTSAPATSATIHVDVVQQSSRAISYTGAWANESRADLMGGHARESSSKGAKATLTFTGRAVSIVATKAPKRGKVEIWIDGRLSKTISLLGTHRHPRMVIYRAAWTTSGRHVVQVRVHGHRLVDLDAFVIIR